MVLRAEIVQNQNLYNFAKKWFAIASLLAGPASFFYNAPFGRFAGNDQSSIFFVDGIKAWVIMESASFITCIFAYMTSPLSFKNYGHSPPITPSNPSAILSGLFLLHYTNRAFISPLRTPTRSKFHIIVPLCAVTYTIVNGTLIGAYLSSNEAKGFLEGAYGSPRFWLGVGLWVVGFVGNILHDEILYDLRRNVNKEQSTAVQPTNKKEAEEDDTDIDTDTEASPTPSSTSPKPHYAIPHGLLYTYISYPNYFCEWLEWLGFALASSPLPSPFNLDTYAPPWVFLLSEVATMFPRAWRGHEWYLRRFEGYPRGRRAVVPFVL
ncbi:3-oxo-5-alpha-steroid 4-dehydrogenase-domain-containing protein [Irpex lacteus]|nr:3-oxo-5-alpha-steroid 4-dehydrogenase-domain-containing protein [Irpex lacteus]